MATLMEKGQSAVRGLLGIKQGLADFKVQLDSTRAELEQKRKRKLFLETAPLNCADSLARAFQYIDASAALYYEGIHEIAAEFSHPGQAQPDPFHRHLLFDRSNVKGYESAFHTLVHAFHCAIDNQDIKAALTKAFEARDWSMSGPPLSERTAEIANLEITISTLESDLKMLEAQMRELRAAL